MIGQDLYEIDGTICSGHRGVATEVPLLVVMVVDGCA
jgi:hypothetical protein